MILREEIPELLVEALPSFHESCAESVSLYGADNYYAVAGALADHLLILHRQNGHTQFATLAAAIEKLHIDGEPYVAELATIGILEGIQDVWRNSSADPEEFAMFLLPVSRQWRRSLNRFWNGEIGYVGEDIRSGCKQ